MRVYFDTDLPIGSPPLSRKAQSREIMFLRALSRFSVVCRCRALSPGNTANKHLQVPVTPDLALYDILPHF